ncbi:MAG: hypothetical protein J1E62_06940 [Lachnospiraceae bacterium]|nr:hypothetical protein [Lachnospiraceae bacterium]
MGASLLLFLLASLFVSRQASAAGASISVSTKQQSVQRGDTVYVVITVKSSTPMSGFEGYFSYDNKVLQFLTGGSIVHGNDDEFQISDIEREGTSTTLKYSVKFRARKEGSSTITLKKPYNVYGGSISEKMSVSYDALTVVVKKKGSTATKPVATAPSVTADPNANKNNPPAEGSDSGSVPPEQNPDESGENPVEQSASPAPLNPDTATLTSLSVAGVALSPEFSPGVFRYSGQIGTYDSKLDISYETKEKDASVTIKGNKDLQLGKNVIKLIVKTKSGVKKTYRLTIKVTEPQPSAAPVTSNGVRAVSGADGITLYGAISIQVTTPDKEDIPKGFGKTELEIDGQIVEAYALESDTEHTYVLIYGMSEGKEQFFLYDREENAVYPYTKVKAWYRSGASGLVPEEEDALQVSNKRLKYIVGILLALSALFLLGIISLYMRLKGIDPDEIKIIRDDEESID